MLISNLIQSFKRNQEQARIKNSARLNKEIEISNEYSGFSLSQIIDLISHEEEKLARTSFFRRSKQRIFIAGLYRARRRIGARAKAAARYEEMSTLANAPTLLIQKKKAA